MCALLLSLFISNTASASTVTVWAGNSVAGSVIGISTYDLSGTELDFIPSAVDIGGMTTVGNEIWVGAASGQVERLDASGAPLGPVSFAPFHIGGMTTVVPLPPALWLFGSGLLGLIGMARKKTA